MVATVRNLTSSSAALECFRHDGGYYFGSNGDAGALHAKREEHREASAWHGSGLAALGLRPGARVSSRAFEKLLRGHVPGTEIRLGRLRHVAQLGMVSAPAAAGGSGAHHRRARR